MPASAVYYCILKYLMCQCHRVIYIIVSQTLVLPVSDSANIDHLGEVVYARFLQGEVTLPFPHCSLWKESLESEKVGYTSLRSGLMGEKL